MLRVQVDTTRLGSHESFCDHPWMTHPGFLCWPPSQFGDNFLFLVIISIDLRNESPFTLSNSFPEAHFPKKLRFVSELRDLTRVLERTRWHHVGSHTWASADLASCPSGVLPPQRIPDTVLKWCWLPRGLTSRRLQGEKGERTERVEGFWRKIGRAHAPTEASIKSLLHIMALNPSLQASSWQCCSQSLLHNFTNSWPWTAVKDKPLRKALWPVYTTPLFAAGAWVICHKNYRLTTRESRHCG